MILWTHRLPCLIRQACGTGGGEICEHEARSSVETTAVPLHYGYVIYTLANGSKILSNTRSDALKHAQIFSQKEPDILPNRHRYALKQARVYRYSQIGAEMISTTGEMVQNTRGYRYRYALVVQVLNRRSI